MEADDYESLPTNTTASTHMLAGAAAGILEHVVMYPVDCVKTRMQSLAPDTKARYRNVMDALYRIIRTEGTKNTLRGINAVVGGAGPAHAMYFACYEQLKKTLSSGHKSNHLVHEPLPSSYYPMYVVVSSQIVHKRAALPDAAQVMTNVLEGVAGVGATLLHDAVMNPADVIKQRMQMYQSPYKTCLECARTTWQHEGVRAFYRSYTTQLTMNIPFQSLHFIVYEAMQDLLNKERQFNPETHVVSGAVAGAVAAAVTTPLDVCKTLLNTQESCALSKGESAITGMTHAFRTIYQFRGFSGFFQGLSARVIFQMPSTAISWGVYEFFKYAITKKQQAECDGYVAPSGVHVAVQVHASSR